MPDLFTASYAPRTRSRIHGPRRVLQELKRIRTKAARALEHRKLTEHEQRWLGVVYDALTIEIAYGEQVLPGHDAPDRKVRKRPTKAIMRA